MLVNGKQWRSIWIDEVSGDPTIIDQTLLPHRFETLPLSDAAAAAEAIRAMRVRGAPLIGATAAHGMALALLRDATDEAVASAARTLMATRPTAINLHWAIDRVGRRVGSLAVAERAAAARAEAISICDEDVAVCESIGEAGLSILRDLSNQKSSGPLNVLTHCNAGWLATVDWGTALAPIYKAHAEGLPIHVWVDETRPRNQGASLTAWELREQGVPHTVIVDSAGGHLMQTGDVDVVLVGSDRTTAAGDVCNKIGTYLKALAAKDNGVPFYVCLPCSSIDWTISDGLSDVPIEERSGEEIRVLDGRSKDGEVVSVALFDAATPAFNPAFDITPAALVSGLITEYGVFSTDAASLSRLERRTGGALPADDAPGDQRGFE